MSIRTFIYSCLILILSGCIYNEPPMPEITHVGQAKIDLPPIIEPAQKNTYENAPANWIPPGNLENKHRWRGIIVHHSDSYYGCAAHIDKVHKSKGWGGLGYDFVINNGVFRRGYGKADGAVEVGYRWSQQKTGAHCNLKNDKTNYWNRYTIGICLIGDFEKTRPTEKQWRSLVKLISFLQKRYSIPTSQIKGHRDIKPTKCPGPNLSLTQLKRRLAQYK